MEENKTRKVIIMSMAGLLIGCLLFIFGVSIKASSLPMIVNYVCSVLLFVCAFLAVFNNHKLEKHSIYIYIMVLDIVLITLVTYVFISNLI